VVNSVKERVVLGPEERAMVRTLNYAYSVNGHREKTWTAENGVHWLRDLLPEDLPQARILCGG
jgi:hypothetical protein